ncbi:methionine synthase reductase isoform X1 [Stomoxys calcitrans]|uniref:methionine synthase reductase isoform X1 n=2 Tax=Stomoxys calcitrans TaxID=35570 RepID=UPI0027E37B5E|nr:methionine synthase reductase isoform X1 [Stomoxys calcitrans]
MNEPHTDINIKDFILKSFKEAKPLSVEPCKTLYADEMVPSDKHNHCSKHPFARSQVFNVPIKKSELLVISGAEGTNNKNIIKITLKTKELGLEWEPGDTIGILPTNSDKDVEFLLNRLDALASADYEILSNAGPLTSGCSVRQILRDRLSLRSILKKQFLSALGDYCGDNEEKMFLKCLSSKEATSFYNELIINKRLTLLDILKICPSCKPPIEFLSKHLPSLLARPYSIANSPLANSNEISIVFSLLNEKPGPGVTTSMLSKKSEENNPSVSMYLRESNTFRYTIDDYGKNQIFIAIGTGLAPFLGFLQHKEEIKKQALSKTEGPGQSWLFVGATSEEAVIGRDQLLKWQSLNVLNKFVEAHSRCQTSVFKYVQDALMKYSHEIFEFLMTSDATLYLCADGGGEITKCIEGALADIIKNGMHLQEVNEAMQVLKEFKTSGKYKLDLWL